jgi:hypothetical protein
VAGANSPEIRDSLELIGRHWVFSDNALQQKSGADKRAQAAVATTSERILQEMEVVVAQYEKLEPSEKAELALVRR